MVILFKNGMFVMFFGVCSEFFNNSLHFIYYGVTSYVTSSRRNSTTQTKTTIRYCTVLPNEQNEDLIISKKQTYHTLLLLDTIGEANVILYAIPYCK